MLQVEPSQRASPKRSQKREKHSESYPFLVFVLKPATLTSQSRRAGQILTDSGRIIVATRMNLQGPIF